MKCTEQLYVEFGAMCFPAHLDEMIYFQGRNFLLYHPLHYMLLCLCKCILCVLALWYMFKKKTMDKDMTLKWESHIHTVVSNQTYSKSFKVASKSLSGHWNQLLFHDNQSWLSPDSSTGRSGSEESMLYLMSSVEWHHVIWKKLCWYSRRVLDLVTA